MSIRAAASVVLVALTAPACGQLLGADFDDPQLAGSDGGTNPDADGIDANGALCEHAGNCRGGPCESGVCLDVVSVHASGDHTCALLSDQSVWCWGSNSHSVLGRGLDLSRSRHPLRVPGLSGVVALAVGANFNCALTAEERVLCWGANQSGQLGDGTTKTRAQPAPVVELTEATEIHASSGEGAGDQLGGEHACARVSSGAVYCWGSNRFGELGWSKSVLASAVPIHDAELSTASGIVLGYRDTCRIEDGRLACRGASGFGDEVASTAPDSSFEEVDGFDGATLISIGAGFIHAKFSGVAHAWGKNGAGQLCLGTRTLPVGSSTIPLPSRLADAAELRAGGEHVCARRSDGRVYCCGDDRMSQTGPDPTGEVPVLEPAPGESTVELTVGDNHACALIARDNRREIRCWGSNADGQLGDGTTLPRVEPVPVQWLAVNDVE